MTTQPIVGITSRHGNDEWVQENTINYINVLNGYGVKTVVLSPDTPVTLPDGSTYSPDEKGRLPLALLDRLDGLVLAGGGDVDPSYFDQPLAGANEAGIDLKRDELELTLARRAMELDLPTFGICRGCQVLNVAAGGGMVQHFEGHRSSTDKPVLHDVIFQQESHIHGMVGLSCLRVNTYHHQGMDLTSMSPAFTVVGMSAAPDDWLVEAFESPDHRWLVGVQWHPERLYELDEAHRGLWEGFVAACRA